MTGFSYVMEEETLLGLLSGLAAGIPGSVLSIAGYVLTAMALYTLAQRRGLTKPWLAWIPVANVWLLGSLSDQYQYVVRGQDKSKRKWLLGLNIAKAALCVILGGGLLTAAVRMFTVLMREMPQQQLLNEILRSFVGMTGLLLPLSAVSIAFAVIRFMALYDVYKSMDPGNSLVFLVLSILFGVTEPFFLFFNRYRDEGMPPRRQTYDYAPPNQEPEYTANHQEPYYQPPQSHVWDPPAEQEHWEKSDKDYL